MGILCVLIMIFFNTTVKPTVELLEKLSQKFEVMANYLTENKLFYKYRQNTPPNLMHRTEKKAHQYTNSETNNKICNHKSNP